MTRTRTDTRRGLVGQGRRGGQGWKCWLWCCDGCVMVVTHLSWEDWSILSTAPTQAAVSHSAPKEVSSSLRCFVCFKKKQTESQPLETLVSWQSPSLQSSTEPILPFKLRYIVQWTCQCLRVACGAIRHCRPDKTKVCIYNIIYLYRHVKVKPREPPLILAVFVVKWIWVENNRL